MLNKNINSSANIKVLNGNKTRRQTMQFKLYMFIQSFKILLRVKLYGKPQPLILVNQLTRSSFF